MTILMAQMMVCIAVVNRGHAMQIYGQLFRSFWDFQKKMLF